MEEVTIGITGLNAVDNPAPGVGVARSLKEDSGIRYKIVGLSYDAMEPGNYLDALIEKSYIIPYPSSSCEAFIERLLYIKKNCGLDFLLPTLDSELPFFIKYCEELAANGIKTFLPTSEQFKLRGKDHLENVAERIGISSPRMEVVSSYEALEAALENTGLPAMVKGALYGARLARTFAEAAGHFHAIASEWGYPIIIQQVIAGEEMNVVGVGDGEGGSLGFVGIKKLSKTSLGKIWTGVTIHNEKMLAAADRFLKEFEWKSAFELECMMSAGEVFLIEINPRFPSWSYFATGVGINLPANMVRKALGLALLENNSYEAGKLYIRYTYELISDMAPYQKMIMLGEK